MRGPCAFGPSACRASRLGVPLRRRKCGEHSARGASDRSPLVVTMVARRPVARRFLCCESCYAGSSSRAVPRKSGRCSTGTRSIRPSGRRRARRSSMYTTRCWRTTLRTRCCVASPGLCCQMTPIKLQCQSVVACRELVVGERVGWRMGRGSLGDSGGEFGGVLGRQQRWEDWARLEANIVGSVGCAWQGYGLG